MLVLAVTLTVLLGGAAPAPAQEADIADRLAAVPGLTVVQELPTAVAGYRFFALTFTQPADHQRPWLGSFEQRLRLMYRGTDRPTLLHTGGYGVRTAATLTEVARLIGGNQLNVEHRFFTPSIPDPANWTKLTIWQAATDHHRLLEALKPLFTQRWLSAGSSKGGMATVYHRTFYPYDVDGSVAYVAPNDAEYPGDWKYDRFLEEVGDDPSCVDRLQALQYEALGPRRKEMLARFTAWAAANGQTFHKTLGSADRTYEFTVLDTAWTFWQNTGQTGCPTVPERSAPTDALYAFIDTALGWDAYTDQGNEFYLPYYFQAATQLGYPEMAFRHLRKVRRYPDLYRARSFVPGFPVREDPWSIPAIDLWVRFLGSELLFVYGENDPWGAERFAPGRWTRDTHVYEVAGGTHTANITQLPQPEEDEATAIVRRWAGQATAAPQALQRQAEAAPEDEPAATGARP
jgi:hypothetical protein